MPIFADARQTKDSKDPSTSPPEKPTSKSIAPYPTEMSCRQAFDSAFYCQSLGGQFNNVYRYGTLKDCSGHWSEFWFCMRNKSRSEEVKKSAIEEWYREKEKKYRMGASSEDIWEERSVRLERAFDWDPDEVVEDNGRGV